MITGPSTADVRIDTDPVSNIIQVDGSRFWKPDDFELMLDRLAALVASAHGASRRARVLVDFAEAGAQVGDTVARIGQRSHSMYAPGDRLAIVLRSAILKMQIARVGRAAEYRIFDSAAAEAEAWRLSPPAD